MKIFFGILALFVLFGCSSSESEKKNLDIIAKPAPTPKKAKSKPLPKVNWKKFFKPPPKPQEFANLKNRLRKWPDETTSKGLLKKARAYSIVGELRASEANYRKLIRLDEEHIVSHIEIAQLYIKMNDVDRCLSYLSRVKELFSEQESNDQSLVFQYRYTLALAYLRQRDTARGHAILSSLISKDKSFAPAYAAMASSYFQEEKLDIAEFVAKRGIDRGEEDPRLTNLLGVIAFRRGHIVKAKRWYDRALKLSPNFVPALVNRASLSLYRGEYEAAHLDLRHALGLNPIYTEAYIVQGILQKKSGEFAQAEVSFQKAIDLDPENGHARYNLGVLKAEALEDPGEALRLFNEVLQVDKSQEELKDLARVNIESLQQSHLRFAQ